MNRVVKSVLAVVVLATVSFADTIIMRNGHNVENARILSVGDDNIEFQIDDESYTLPKSEVAQIRYDDGRVEEFGARQPRPFVAPQAASAPPPAPAPAPAQSRRERSAEVGAGREKHLGGKLSLDQYRVGGTAGTGWGFAGGLTLNVPLTDKVNFRPELGFTYRLPDITPVGQLTYKNNGDPDRILWDGSSSTREFAINIPLMINTSVSESSRLNFETGLQFDIPFGTTRYVTTVSGTGGSSTTNFSVYVDRRIIDIGLVYGVAMRVSDNFSVGLRGVTYLNTPYYTGTYGTARYNVLGLNINMNLASF